MKISPEILLLGINARYIHPNLGLRYLRANLGSLRERSHLLEYTIKEDPHKILNRIKEEYPKLKVLALSVYLWNLEKVLEFLRILFKSLEDGHFSPEVSSSLKVVLGGPEVSFEWERKTFDFLRPFLRDKRLFVISGEGERPFFEFCQEEFSLNDEYSWKFPYGEYSEEDILNKIIYVESSRGCPFSCEFCLSANDKVRNFHQDSFLKEIENLIEKGGRSFKFIDRTFNLDKNYVLRLLSFFLSKIENENKEENKKDNENKRPFFLHFEVVPEYFPLEIKKILKRFPKGSLQLEVGIQTFNSEVAKRIGRPLNESKRQKIHENIQYLVSHTEVYLHTDLIVGLPGEDLISFGKSFEELLSLKPHEIQVGILKRLPGALISRHSSSFHMHYREEPPYDLLSNKDISEEEMNFMKVFASLFDAFCNSGRFSKTLSFLNFPRNFFDFKLFTQKWIEVFSYKTHGIELHEKFKFLYDFLIREKLSLDLREFDCEKIKDLLGEDFLKTPGRVLPDFLKRERKTDKKDRDRDGVFMKNNIYSHQKRQSNRLK